MRNGARSIVIKQIDKLGRLLRLQSLALLLSLPYESFLSLVISFGKTKVKDIFALPVEGGHKRK